MSRRKEAVIPAELLDQLLAGTDAAAALDQGGDHGYDAGAFGVTTSQLRAPFKQYLKHFDRLTL